MLPAYRRRMGEEIVRSQGGCRSQMLGGGVHVDRVPIDDRRDNQIEAGCPILLGFMATVDDAPLTESVDRLRQDMVQHDVVETGVAPPAQVRIFKPVQHEQRPLDFADFLKRDVELVLSVDRRAKGTPLAG